MEKQMSEAEARLADAENQPRKASALISTNK
jgi:hypothetical protein